MRRAGGIKPACGNAGAWESPAAAGTWAGAFGPCGLSRRGPVGECGMGEEFVRRSKLEQLAARMAALGIFERELVEKFVRGSGPGGQKLNKTSSCVYLKHLPSGMEVKAARSRSRELNRFLARRELCDRIEAVVKGAESARQLEIERIRRRKSRRSRRQKDRMLAEKKHRAAVKRLRAPVAGDG